MIPDADKAPQQRQATALHYEQGDTAPQVVATGRGHVAERIITAAEAAGVPMRSDPALAKALAALDLDDEIPEQLYRAVAETLAWAYRLDGDAAAARRLR
jgi:flagellar biosynthesis protein